MDFLTDQDIDSMFDEEEEAPLPSPEPELPQVQLYPLALAGVQAPAVNGQPNGESQGIVGIAKRKWGPLPAWAWALLGGSVAAGGYFFYKSRKSVTPNEDSGESSSRPSIGEVLTSTDHSEQRGGWSPSRSAFAAQLENYYKKKGMSDQATVWHDADDAKKKGKMAFVSPLINVEVKKGSAVKVDPALTRFCRREGLNPIAHQDGNIGLYPHSSKRGKEWEEYIDALRDEGQSV